MKEVFDLRASRVKHSREVVRGECSNGNASTSAAVSALYVAWRYFHARPPEEAVCTDRPLLLNLHVANHLSWLCNTALCIRVLVNDGLEPQARVVMRTLSEAIYQTLVLFHDYESFERYLQGIDRSSTKEVHFELFSKKQRLHKMVQVLVDEFKIQSPQERVKQYEQRLGMFEHYSQATHTAAIHVLTSALQPSPAGEFVPTILGYPSIASQNTLVNCAHEVSYFGMLLEHIVINTWKVNDAPINSDFALFSEMYRLAALFLKHQPSTPAPAEPT